MGALLIFLLILLCGLYLLRKNFSKSWFSLFLCVSVSVSVSVSVWPCGAPA
jgi:hypothetical protein